MSVRLLKVLQAYPETVVYLATVDVFLKPVKPYKKHVTHFGVVYKGIIKRPYGYDEVLVDEKDVVCDVTEMLQREYAASRIARYWRAYRACKIEKALATLRPAMMHWAFRPDGPLGRKLIASYSSK